MQRIDEDTYIDDTLVTCAEYQLFIDEMREQGKYFQPDHWTSYQFPKGQARDPIVGVRNSDAVEFCKWLTERNNEKWKFRLPRPSEIINHNKTTKSSLHSQFGYWVIEPHSAFDFIRTIFTGNNSRKIDVDSVNKYVLDSILNGSKAKKPLNARRKFMDEYRFPSLQLNLVMKRKNSCELDIDKTYNNFIAVQKNIVQSSRLTKFINIIYLRNKNYKLEHLFEDAFYTIVTAALDIVYERERNPVLDIFADIYTLRERIAGRSPAFEGIRLVKERIR